MYPGAPGWVQKQQQAAEQLARRKALMASMPPAHKHAFELLEARKVEVEQIVRVDPDAILFLSKAGPQTAWVRGVKPPALGLARVCVEDGFPCEPGPGVLAAFGET